MASIWDTGVNTAPGGGTMFWTPGSTYGAGESYWSSPISQNIRERELPLAFSSFLSRAGIGDTDSAFNRWVYQQYPRFERAYGMATMENPFITIDAFTRTLPTAAGLFAQFQQQSPDMRGIDPRRYAPVARWITR